MRDYANYPAIELYFDQNGAPVDASIAAELHAFVTTGAAANATDLFVFSHGWNNTDDEAYTELYEPFFTNLQSLVAANTVPFAGRVPAVAAVYWPSKAFVFGAPPAQGQSAEDPVPALIDARLDQVAAMFPGDAAATAAVAAARAAIPNLDSDPAAADAFVAALAGIVPHDPLVDEGLTAAMAVVQGAAGRDVLAAIGAARSGGLATPALVGAGPSDSGGGASLDAGPAAPPDFSAGSGAGLLGDITNRVASSAADFLNLFTYYTMKQRAGVVGATGLAPLLANVRAARKLRVHLIGHSFGGRLVTSAANALAAPATVNSISLLQAAYSHYGMAKDWDQNNTDGAFRAVIGNRKATDFILATHSVHDSAVGTWYPIASELMRQVGAAAQAPVSEWGGMGGDGAQATPESTNDVLAATGTDYAPFKGGIWLRNIDGSGPDPLPTIHEHGDVTKPEIVSAIALHVDRYSTA
jgi:hypothetical protein